MLLLVAGLLLVNLNLAHPQVEFGDYCLRAAPGLAVLAVLLLLVHYGLQRDRRDWFMSILAMTPSESQFPTRNSVPDRVWNSIGWLCLVGAFAYLEWMQPYYFAQDDALVGELPGILLGCRSYWDGVFPNWNPYVFLGAPLASIGFWALTYPPQLLAYAIARHLLGDELATMEVFAALHLAVGFVAMRYLARRLGMGALHRQRRRAVVCSRRLHLNHGPLLARLCLQCRLVAAVGHRDSAVSRRFGRLEMGIGRGRGAWPGISRGLSADCRHTRYVFRHGHCGDRLCRSIAMEARGAGCARAAVRTRPIGASVDSTFANDREP